MLTKQNLLIALAIVTSLTTTSCGQLFLMAYGMKSSPKPMTENKIITQAKKWNIPINQVYELEVEPYKAHFSKIDTTLYNHMNLQTAINNYMQPLQLFYYNPKGELISRFVNCNAGGFPNLNWNQSGAFDHSFPPLPSLTKLDSLITLKDQLAFSHALQKSEHKLNIDSNYIVVVFWNRFMGRQSKRLIEYVHKNIAQHHVQKAIVIYINNDIALYELMK
jgi:hypothetical protein